MAKMQQEQVINFSMECGECGEETEFPVLVIMEHDPGEDGRDATLRFGVQARTQPVWDHAASHLIAGALDDDATD